MLRNFEVGDKVTVQPFIGEPYTGKIIKIGSSIIHVELLKHGDRSLAELRLNQIMKFSKNNLIGLGKDKWYEIIDMPFGEHEKYSE